MLNARKKIKFTLQENVHKIYTAGNTGTNYIIRKTQGDAELHEKS